MQIRTVFADSVTFVLLVYCSAFNNITGKNTDIFSYNPCYSFTEEGCNNVAVSVATYVHMMMFINTLINY